MGTANSTLCAAHTDQLAQALANLRTATTRAAERPSPTLVERYNDAHSWVTATVHECWACPHCQQAAASADELPLFATCL